MSQAVISLPRRLVAHLSNDLGASLCVYFDGDGCAVAALRQFGGIGNALAAKAVIQYGQRLVNEDAEQDAIGHAIANLADALEG